MKDDVTKLMIDPLSGEIKTVAGLDYERSVEPRLVVGTEQAMLARTLTDTSTATVILSDSDLNDTPPFPTFLASLQVGSDQHQPDYYYDSRSRSTRSR